MHSIDEILAKQAEASDLSAKIKVHKAMSEDKLKQLNAILQKYGCTDIQQLAAKRDTLYKELEDDYNKQSSYIQTYKSGLAELDAML